MLDKVKSVDLQDRSDSDESADLPESEVLAKPHLGLLGRLSPQRLTSRIVVLNQPDLGKVPLVLGTPASALLTALSQQHNAALGAALTQLSTLPGLELVPVNVNVAFGHVPASANATIPALDALFPPPGPGEVPMSRCLLLNAAACRNVPTFDVDLQYVFWDVQHPTTEVHRLIAEQILATFVD